MLIKVSYKVKNEYEKSWMLEVSQDEFETTSLVFASKDKHKLNKNSEGEAIIGLGWSKKDEKLFLWVDEITEDNSKTNRRGYKK